MRFRNVDKTNTAVRNYRQKLTAMNRGQFNKRLQV